MNWWRHAFSPNNRDSVFFLALCERPVRYFLAYQSARATVILTMASFLRARSLRCAAGRRETESADFAGESMLAPAFLPVLRRALFEMSVACFHDRLRQRAPL